MPVISKKNALELQKIIKEATGRDLSFGDSFALLGHLCGLLKLLWFIEDGVYKPKSKKQLELFRSKSDNPQPH